MAPLPLMNHNVRTVPGAVGGVAAAQDRRDVAGGDLGDAVGPEPGVLPCGDHLTPLVHVLPVQLSWNVATHSFCKNKEIEKMEVSTLYFEELIS